MCEGKYFSVLAGSLPLFGTVLSRVENETALLPAAVCVYSWFGPTFISFVYMERMSSHVNFGPSWV